MSNSINNIPVGLRVPSQVPLDAKVYMANEASLANLGPGNNLAYTYYKGMIAYCAQEETRWEWREPNFIGEIGLLLSNFIYPAGLNIFGINYGNKQYNFFPITLSSVGPNPQDLVNGIELSFDWKKGTQQNLSRVPSDLPEKVTDNVYTRNGFIGYHKPIKVGNQVVHPLIDEGEIGEREPVLFEAFIYNLGVKIKKFTNIENYNPVLVISKYTPSFKKETPNPLLDYPNPTWTKGSYKITNDLDTVRLTRVPLQASYQVIDFGQEHYFRTSKGLQNTPSFTMPIPISGPGLLFFATRGAQFKYSQCTINNLESKAFVYLQFHIEITVNGNKFLSKPLGRLKMILKITPAIGVTYPIAPGDIVPYDFYGIFKKTIIYFKHT